MTDPQTESTQSGDVHREDATERLPWVTPRLDSIKFQDAKSGVDLIADTVGSHS